MAKWTSKGGVGSSGEKSLIRPPEIMAWWTSWSWQGYLKAGDTQLLGWDHERQRSEGDWCSGVGAVEGCCFCVAAALHVYCQARGGLGVIGQQGLQCFTQSREKQGQTKTQRHFCVLFSQPLITQPSESPSCYLTFIFQISIIFHFCSILGHNCTGKWVLGNLILI